MQPAAQHRDAFRFGQIREIRAVPKLSPKEKIRFLARHEILQYLHDSLIRRIFFGRSNFPTCYTLSLTAEQRHKMAFALHTVRINCQHAIGRRQSRQLECFQYKVIMAAEEVLNHAFIFDRVQVEYTSRPPGRSMTAALSRISPWRLAQPAGDSTFHSSRLSG